MNNNPHVIDLARAIVEHMGADWKAEKHKNDDGDRDYSHYALLVHKSGAKLGVWRGYSSGRAECRPDVPSDENGRQMSLRDWYVLDVPYGQQCPVRCSFDVTRAPKAIAGQILRGVGEVYLPLYGKIMEKLAERTTKRKAAREGAVKLAQILGQHYDPNKNDRQWLGPFTITSDGGIELRQLYPDPELAIALAKVLKAHEAKKGEE